MDKGSLTKLAAVHPELAKRVAAILAALPQMDIRVVQGLRTYAEQDALYSVGRTKMFDPKGKKLSKVTNAKGGQSNHNFGLACDLCLFTDDKPDWDDTKAFDRIGAAAKKQGLDWGGDWKFLDRPHVELTPRPTLAECRSLYQKGGLDAVWRRASELLGSKLPAPILKQPSGQESTGIKHTVASGDTLSGIAAKYKTTVAAITKLNALKSTVIKIGQELKIK